jgi:hypothetical protein
MARGTRKPLDVATRQRIAGAAHLDQLLDQADEIREQIDQQAAELVLAGMGWAELGRLLGVTRQSAAARYRPLVDGWRETYGPMMPWELREIEASIQYTDEHGNPLPQ